MSRPFLSDPSRLSSEFFCQRDRILREHREAVASMRRIEKEIEGCLRTSDPRWRELEKDRNAFYVRIEPLINAYWDLIPSVGLSRCPFCDADLSRIFDPVDLKGFWWIDRTQRERPEPPACEHFCLLLGAVNGNGARLETGSFECHPGPGAPFVVPRILEFPTMQAVVSAVPMDCGYTAYPVAYFSAQPLPERSLTQAWARKQYHFRMNDGRQGWDITDERYDYDLAPWIVQGKVRWLTGEGMSPPDAPMESCPFQGVQGVRSPQFVPGQDE